MPFISFCKINDARTGNILFQYLICKQLGLQYGHTYIPYEDIPSMSEDTLIYATDTNIHELLNMTDHNKDRLLNMTDEIQVQNIRQKNIICNGFFQKSEYYIKDREHLLNILYNTDDYWIYKNKKEYIRDFLYSSHSLQLQSDDIVISLRLDDFIQMPCPTSDIIPPQYYMNILETNRTSFSKVYIVCDMIRHDWEHKYLEFFQKWNPILLQKDLQHDCALIRESPYLIHSNSTLCWFMSFVANKPKIRYIPKTHFYAGQSLNEIESTDQLTNVSPLIHHNVYWLNVHNWLIENSIFPLSYCIPDECICSDEEALKNKHIVLADLIPGEPFTYRYGHDQEDEYNQSYRESRFAITHKKGGWECLRHYEIMANGCIPIFKNLQHCPPLTLTSFPKELIINANRELLPWKKEYTEKYNDYVQKMLAHMRTHCSTSATIEYFLSKMIVVNPQITKMRNVLLIMGNCGVNYTRETFWIGLKRYIQSLNGVAVEYPKMDFLYDSYMGNKKGLYGNGFTYSSRLKDDFQLTNEDIVQKIDTHFWDLIVYGKVGPDELVEGSHPNMPLWDHVFKQYGKHEIVFLYGGDECIDLSYENRYRQHILYHSQYANCFVREYKIK
jgi:hypothetical protein